MERHFFHDNFYFKKEHVYKTKFTSSSSNDLKVGKDHVKVIMFENY